MAPGSFASTIYILAESVIDVKKSVFQVKRNVSDVVTWIILDKILGDHRSTHLIDLSHEFIQMPFVNRFFRSL